MPKTPFSERLIAARAKARITQRELAELAGISQRQVARYEGGIQQPRPTTIHRLADALNVTPRWLLGVNEGVETVPLPTLLMPQAEGDDGGGVAITFRFRLPVADNETEEDYLRRLMHDESAPLFYRTFAKLQLAGEDEKLNQIIHDLLLSAAKKKAERLGIEVPSSSRNDEK